MILGTRYAAGYRESLAFEIDMPPFHGDGFTEAAVPGQRSAGTVGFACHPVSGWRSIRPTVGSDRDTVPHGADPDWFRLYCFALSSCSKDTGLQVESYPKQHPGSSAGQSDGFLIRRSEVRALSGVPIYCSSIIDY